MNKYDGIIQGCIFLKPVEAETEEEAKEMMIQQVIEQLRDEKDSPLAIWMENQRHISDAYPDFVADNILGEDST